MQITIDLGKIADGVKAGDSIAVNGVCLTLAAMKESTSTFDLSSETLSLSTFGQSPQPVYVNIERALKTTDRFGGHFVLGHVDGIAIIKSIKTEGSFKNITFSADSKLLEQMVVKGSVAVDGISLTIADMDRLTFHVAVIPETLNRTTLGQAKIGDKVNIETDIIVKVIKKQLSEILPLQQGLTVEKLKKLGF